MSSISIENSLDVIEVPPELRGLSDEEIIKNSEKPLRECSGKRKNGAKRPSKRERLAQKQQKELEDIQLSATSMFEKTIINKQLDYFRLLDEKRLSHEKKEMLTKAFTTESKSYSIYDTDDFDIKENDFAQSKLVDYIKPFSSKSSIPSTARVLKASFGVKTNEKPKATIISAADLAQQRIEERARKIREALINKRKKELSEV